MSISKPVGEGMLMTSEAMEMISSSRTWETIDFDNFSEMDNFVLSIIQLGHSKVVGIGEKFFAAGGGDKEIVFKAQAPAFFPVNPRLDGQDHVGFHHSGSGFVRIGRFMSAGADSVSDGMRRRGGVAGLVGAGANDAVDFAERGSVFHHADGFIENFEEQFEQAIVFRRESSRADIFGEISPVAVGADPDFDEGGFVLLDRAVRSGGEGSDALTGPDQSESAGHSDLIFVADADGVDVALDHSGYFAFLHASADIFAGLLHANGSELIGEAHAVDFLGCFDGAQLGKEWRGVDDLFRDWRKGIEIALSVKSWFADHAIANLRALIELDTDAAGQLFLAQNFESEVEGARGGRARIGRVVEAEEADVFIPGRALRFVKLRLDDEKSGVAFARENGDVVALHGPVIG